MHWNCFGGLAAVIAHVAAPIMGRVTIKDFMIITWLRNSDPIAVSRYRRKVGNNDQEFITGFSFADERQNAVVGVTGVNPFKTAFFKVVFIQGRFILVKPIQVLHKSLQPPVIGSFSKLIDLFPFPPAGEVEDKERCKKALEHLKRAREAEEKGLKSLEKIVPAL